MPYIRFHDFRHTHATLMLQGGIHLKVVSERLGHSTIGITWTHPPYVTKHAKRSRSAI
ncbi:tyrosine-type recombinase/integrase [Weizmannia ginsengihumi]|nr:tyrosine-type recombinase/integrase [Heyndrickxia ginsengihumi]MCM3024852.1 tyrosine-type recombinase/integrase [Heyndrickxia ginsengihumi]